MDAEMWSRIALGGVILCWFGFAAVFLVRKRPPHQREAKRSRVAGLGIFLQGLGYGAIWFRTPQKHYEILPLSTSVPLEAALALLTVALAVGSVWLVRAAVRHLGKQWAVGARLVEGHKLIMDGPYRWLRNPIYTGMFGMLVATGLAMGRWKALAVGCVLFAVGMVIRVRSEEKLLRSAFGAEFEEYAKRVPAVIPGIF